MKSVTVAGSSRKTAGRKGKSKKKRKKGGSVGVSEADLRKFGIVPVGGRKTTGGKKKKSVGRKKTTKKSVGRKKVARKKSTGRRAKTTGSRNVTSAARRALNAAGIKVRRKGTTGRRRTTGAGPIYRDDSRSSRRGVLGWIGDGAWDLTSYGSGALAANALGGVINQAVGKIPWFQRPSTIPWRQMAISLVGAMFVSTNWYKRWAAGGGKDGFWEKNRRGMLGFFGFQAVYGLLRALTGPQYANLNLDRPTGVVDNALSYFAGSNGMIGAGMRAAPGQMAQQASGRSVGGILDLYGQGDYMTRLQQAVGEVQAVRDDLVVALDGLYGDITDDQLAVYNAISDFLSATDNRLSMAQQETDLDRAADFVLEANDAVSKAQALLAGLTAGIGAPGTQQMEAAAEAQQAQQMAMQQQAVSAQAQQQAAYAQQQAQAYAQQAQQLQAVGQTAQAMQAQQTAMQLSQQAQQSQTQAAQAQQQAQAFAQQAQQAAVDAQSYQQQMAMQGPGAPGAIPNYGAPVQGWYA